MNIEPGIQLEMGGKRKFNGRNRRTDDNKRSAGAPERQHYDEIPRENEAFEAYYKAQQIVSEEEWAVLMETLKSPLPTTFRITGYRGDGDLLVQSLQSGSLTAGKEKLDLPAGLRCLPWYRPLNKAWHLDGGRKELRTDPTQKAFHTWMVNATEAGSISRQEAVSMIPPLFLDVQPHHLVLDMCAAPGSKTTQLVEAMHSKTEYPSGLVVANDADQGRSYMLYHQVSRIQSPCLMVTNNDGTCFPVFYHQTTEMQVPDRRQFDRILADVPCSGDGTFRKNAMMWKSWTVNNAMGLHSLQMRLLERAVQLLAVNGRMVYSTCSMNVIENEAVVGHILSKYSHAIRLVDVSQELPELIRKNGRSSWPVVTKEGVVYSSYEEVSDKDRRRVSESMFAKAEYVDLHLDRCMSIYPHFQNTGGFFVAVLEKFADLRQPTVSSSEETVTEEELVDVAAKKAASLMPSKPTEEEFRRLDSSTDASLLSIFDWFGIDRELMQQFQFLVRSDRKPYRSVHMVSLTGGSFFRATAAQYDSEELMCNRNRRLTIVNAGVPAFEIYDTKTPLSKDVCEYRILFESISLLLPLMTKRVLAVESDVMRALLESFDSILAPSITAVMGTGTAVITCGSVSIPVWIRQASVKAFVSKQMRPALIMSLDAQQS